MPDLVVYKKLAISGGGATALDGIDGADLVGNELAFVTLSGNLYHYLLDATSGASESSPDIISPDTNAGSKRWILQAIHAGSGTITAGTLGLVDADVAHGMTDIASTDSFGKLLPISGTIGGLDVYGLTDLTQDGALRLTGIIGATDPTDTHTAVHVRGGKKNGTGWQALAAAETVLRLTNYITDLVTILGNGNVGIGTTGPGAQLEVMSATGGTLRLKRDDTNVTTDEVIGTTEFYTNDGDGAHVAAYIRGLGADLAGQNFGRFGALSFGVSKTAMTDAVEAMRIALSGNVGIGTTEPNGGLEIKRAWDGNYGALTLSGQKPSFILAPDGTGGEGTRKILMHYGSDGPGVEWWVRNVTDNGWLPLWSATVGQKIGFRTITPNASYDIDFEGNSYMNGNTIITGNVGIGTTGPIYTEDVNGPINSRVYYWCDDFDDEAAGVQLESALNADFWTTAGTNYAAANVTYLGGTGGTLKALCANADNDSVTILGLLNVNVTQNPILEARIKIDTKETAAFLIGFASAASAAIDTYPADCFLVGINSDNAHTFGAAQVVAFSNDANAGVDYDNTGVAIVSDTFIKIKIDLTDTEQPRVWINDTEVAAGSITGTVQAGIAMAPYIAVQNLAGGAIQRFVIVDCIKIWADRG